MGGAALEPSTTYAFGFSTVQAPSDGSAINVNLTADEQADYQYMVQKGASVYYHGTATWAGTQSGGALVAQSVFSSHGSPSPPRGQSPCTQATQQGTSDLHATPFDQTVQPVSATTHVRTPLPGASHEIVNPASSYVHTCGNGRPS